MASLEDRISSAISRITSGYACMRIPAEETDPDLVLADCKVEITHLLGMLEQLRVQLAGCGVVAMSNTREALKQQMPERGAYGWSASLLEVHSAVVREINQRERADAAEKAIEMMAPRLPSDSLAEIAGFFYDGPYRNQKMVAVMESALAATGKQQVGETLTDTYVQTVPDKCDRIVWRGHYYHLPIKQVGEAQGSREQFEAWAKNSYFIRRNDAGEYIEPATEDVWVVWQAAIASRQPVGAGVAEGKIKALRDRIEWEFRTVRSPGYGRISSDDLRMILALIDGRDAGAGVGHD